MLAQILRVNARTREKDGFTSIHSISIIGSLRRFFLPSRSCKLKRPDEDENEAEICHKLIVSLGAEKCRLYVPSFSSYGVKNIEVAALFVNMPSTLSVIVRAKNASMTSKTFQRAHVESTMPQEFERSTHRSPPSSGCWYKSKEELLSLYQTRSKGRCPLQMRIRGLSESYTFCQIGGLSFSPVRNHLCLSLFVSRLERHLKRIWLNDEQRV